VSEESTSTFVQPAQPVEEQVVPYLVEPLVEATAILVRDQIVQEINESKPAGRMYRIPGTRYRDGKKGPSAKRGRYRASAPGQAPAEREGIYAARWQFTPAARVGNQVVAHVFNDATVGKQQVPLGAILEYGKKAPADGADGDLPAGGQNAPRPHIGPALAKAQPKIDALTKEASW